MERSSGRVQSFGRRAETPEPVMLPPIMLPPVNLLLEVDRNCLLAIGDAVQQTVYNAALAGLQAAAEDFAAALRGDTDDDGDEPGPDADRSGGGVPGPVPGP